MAELKIEGSSALNLLPDLLSLLPNESSLIRMIETVSYNYPLQRATSTTKRLDDQQSSPPRDPLEGSDIECTQINYEEALYRPRIIENMVRSQVQIIPEEMESPEERNQMVDLMIRVHYQKNLRTEILHLAVTIADRYLALFSIPSAKYLGVGVVTLWMASKMLSKRPKALQRWLKHVPGLTKLELTEIESDILQTLGFQVIVPSPLNFFQMLSTYFQMTKYNYRLCICLLQCALSQIEFRKHSDCVIALSAIYLSFQILCVTQWNDILLCNFNVELKQVTDCSAKLKTALDVMKATQKGNVYRKFSMKENYRITKPDSD